MAVDKSQGTVNNPLAPKETHDGAEGGLKTNLGGVSPD